MSRTAKVTWTDTATNKQRTTEVTVANGGTFETHAAGVIAAAELDGRPDPNRVRIDNIRPAN